MEKLKQERKKEGRKGKRKEGKKQARKEAALDLPVKNLCIEKELFSRGISQ